MTPPRISVIMPVFNNAAYLSESIECLLHQTYSNFEFIILNDGSTDGSEEIIKKYANQDNRIVFIDDRINRGLVYRLNQGLKYAKGEFIARADSDDIYLLTRFEKQVHYLDANPEITICGACYEFIGMRKGVMNLPLSDEDIKISFLDKCTIAHPLVMFRRSFFLENNLEYDSQAVAAEDYDLWTRIAGTATFGNLSEVLLKYRISPTQVSKQKEDLQWENSDKCRARMLNYIWDYKSDEDRRLAGLIACPSSITRVADAEKIFLVLDNLVKQNIGLQFYNEEKFNVFIKEKRKSLVLYVYHNKSSYNIKTLFEFIRASRNFKRALSPLERIKLAIKCIILWKKKNE